MFEFGHQLPSADANLPTAPDGKEPVAAAGGMRTIVKGCAMPALTRRGARTRRRHGGRRRTSLEGGNRSMPRCGLGRLDRYGDSMVRGAAGCGDRVSRPEAAIARWWMATARDWILG